MRRNYKDENGVCVCAVYTLYYAYAPLVKNGIAIILY